MLFLGYKFPVMLTRTWDPRPRPNTQVTRPKPSHTKAKAKDLGPKTKAKDSICQGLRQKRKPKLTTITK